MNTGKLIRKEVEALIIEHTAFTSALTIIRGEISDTFEGFNPCFLLIIGTSRCGKTELLRSIANEYPESRENNRRCIPVLLVEIDSATAPRDLPKSVLEALGIPIPRETLTAGALKKMMFTQLSLARVRVILFDEASHLVDEGSKIMPRAAADWFKALQRNTKDEGNFGIVMSGVPRLMRLIDCNTQFRNRTRKPIRFLPYRWDQVDSRKDFAGCISAFLDIFTKHGCMLEIPINEFLRHSYAASAGQVGLLTNLFVAISRRVDKPCLITRELCLASTEDLNLPGSGLVIPFSTESVSDTDLMHVLVSELDKHDFVLPPSSAEVELAYAKLDNSARSLD